MIALITPTGGRPKQIELCSKFMKHQDYEGKVLWIIVDDVMPVSTDNIARDGWEVIKLFPKPSWKKGQNTQSRNLLVGIEEVKKYDIEVIFIIEDDDYYCPQYLSTMMEKIKDYDVAGQMYTIYYNPVCRGWIRNGNWKHASLFQVAFTPEVLPIFKQTCKIGRGYIDMNFFRQVIKRKVNLFNGKDLAIGIKGLPGRAGIGMGHRMELKMNPDPDFESLKILIGDDYMYYL
jgi:hypothetical protein